MDREKSVPGGVTTVTGGNEVHGAPHRSTLNSHQNRHARLLETGEGILKCHAVMTERLRADMAIRTLRPIQPTIGKYRYIHPGAEMLTLSRDHKHSRRGLPRHGVHRRGQLSPERGNHRVRFFRTVQPNMCDAVGDGEIETFVAHELGSLSTWRAVVAWLGAA